MKISSLLLLAVTGCDSQVDGDHRGEVLAALEGQMHTTTTRTTASADVSVVWTIGSGGTSFVGAETAQVDGMLPSNFTLSVFTTPSADVMSDWDGIRFGAALIAARPQGVDATAWQQWLGVDNNHVLVYLPEAPPVGSAVAGLLHGTPTSGYHVYDVRRLTEAERQQRFDCISKFFNEQNREPTRAEIFSLCGGDGNDELWPSADDIDTVLDIPVVDEFGLDEFNGLPRWSGL